MHILCIYSHTTVGKLLGHRCQHWSYNLVKLEILLLLLILQEIISHIIIHAGHEQWNKQRTANPLSLTTASKFSNWLKTATLWRANIHLIAFEYWMTCTYLWHRMTVNSKLYRLTQLTVSVYSDINVIFELHLWYNASQILTL